MASYSSAAQSSGHFQINWNTSWELSSAAIVRSEGKLWQFLLPDVRISKTNEVSMISLVPIWTSTIHHYSQRLWNHNFVLIPPSLASIPGTGSVVDKSWAWFKSRLKLNQELGQDPIQNCWKHPGPWLSSYLPERKISAHFILPGPGAWGLSWFDENLLFACRVVKYYYVDELSSEMSSWNVNNLAK